MRYLRLLLVFCCASAPFAWAIAQGLTPEEMNKALDVLRNSAPESQAAKAAQSNAPTQVTPAPVPKGMTAEQEKRLREMLRAPGADQGTPAAVQPAEKKTSTPEPTLSPEDQRKVLMLLGQTPATPTPAPTKAVPPAAPTPAPATPTPAPPAATVPTLTVSPGMTQTQEEKARQLLNEALKKPAVVAAPPAVRTEPPKTTLQPAPVIPAPTVPGLTATTLTPEAEKKARELLNRLR